ncbi:ankyrin repeat domain-containing protein 39-like isoform X1 [Dysidea avara]|uniref:ankyrin repeat domain-containing protein 39-like isoform X1 n=1 Tax=Dysidea avara TaxID=196820 RepID=UPI003330446F
MDDHCCDHKTVAAYGVSQSMDEMNFQRGIWCAAMDGELSKVTKFLSSSINPNLTDSSGYTPLHYASRNGHHEVCEALLKGGADVDFQTRGGATALHRAAYMGHMSIVQLLLNHRANVMLQDGDGKTALHKSHLVIHTGIKLVAYLTCMHATDSKSSISTNMSQTTPFQAYIVMPKAC